MFIRLHLLYKIYPGRRQLESASSFSKRLSEISLSIFVIDGDSCQSEELKNMFSEIIFRRDFSRENYFQ